MDMRAFSLPFFAVVKKGLQKAFTKDDNGLLRCECKKCMCGMECEKYFKFRSQILLSFQLIHKWKVFVYLEVSRRYVIVVEPLLCHRQLGRTSATFSQIVSQLSLLLLLNLLYCSV